LPKPGPAPQDAGVLVPAILSGQRVLISTGTKNLQEQIYFKDIPRWRRASARRSQRHMKGR
jgi:ATP-dependent DNA helicase DinG